MRRLIILILVLLGFAGTIAVIASEYPKRNKVLAERIVFKAEQLRDATFVSDLDSPHTEEILDDLKDLIDEYEQNLIFADSPYAPFKYCLWASSMVRPAVVANNDCHAAARLS